MNLIFFISIFSIVISENGVGHHIGNHGNVNGAFKVIANPIGGLHTPDSGTGVQIGHIGSLTQTLRVPFGLDNTNAAVFTLGFVNGAYRITNFNMFGNHGINYAALYTARRNALVRTAWTVAKRDLNLYSIHRDTITLYD